MLRPDPVGIFGLAAVALCWFLAGFLHRSGPRGGLARRLAFLMAVEGLALATSGVPDWLLTLEAREAANWYPGWLLANGVVHFTCDALLLVWYPRFLAAALDTPLVAWLDRPWARRAIPIVAILLLPLVAFAPLTVGAVTLYVVMASLFGFAFLASFSAWRRAPRGPARTRAGTLAVAFGVRDLCWFTTYAVAARLTLQGAGASPSDYPAIWYLVYAGGTFFAVPIIAYGVLRTQLFDIDLRIRWTIKQSSVAGVFIALIYLVTEVAERVLSAGLGSFVGLLAAAVLVFFLAPLQRFGERVASAAMPNTRETPEYLTFRKLQVYESALQDALKEGGISDKERTLLEHLRGSLGVSAADAEALERDLAAAEA